MKVVSGEAAPDRDEEAAQWCLDLADGELSYDRQQAFDHWHADPANAKAFQDAAEAWETVELLGSAPEIVRMRGEALDTYRRQTMKRWRTPIRPSAIVKGAVGVAAAIVLMVLGLSFWPDHDTYRTVVGQRQMATLEDGSRLSLDADSEVETLFGSKQRALVLNRGRARFDVAHNPLRPFTVAVGDKLVVATGTSFSVEVLGSQAHVTLFEGHVAILDNKGGSVPLGNDGVAADGRLLPGHELTMPLTSSGTATIVPVGIQSALAWQKGQVSFDDEPLPLAVERMNRYLAEPLVIGDVGAERTRVTGVYDSADTRGFIEGLRQLSHIRADRRDGKVVLTAE